MIQNNKISNMSWILGILLGLTIICLIELSISARSFHG